MVTCHSWVARALNPIASEAPIPAEIWSARGEMIFANSAETGAGKHITYQQWSRFAKGDNSKKYCALIRRDKLYIKMLLMLNRFNTIQG